LLGRIGCHLGGRPPVVTSQAAAVAETVSLQLLRAEQQLHALTRPRIRDCVAATLEAEKAITSDDTGGALNHEVGHRRQGSQCGTVTISADRDNLAVSAVHACQHLALIALYVCQ
jgi:hypothetical protein